LLLVQRATKALFSILLNIIGMLFICYNFIVLNCSSVTARHIFKFAIFHTRVYEEVVNGGTPFEKGIQVDPRIGRKGSLVVYTVWLVVLYL